MENVANVSIFLTFAERIAIMEYLEEKAAAFPEFSFTALWNGPFYGRALKNAFIGFNLETRTAAIYNQLASITTLSPVSQVVGGVLSIPAKTVNKCLFVASFTPSQNEILAILENHSGKLTVENIGVPDAITQGFETSSKGDMSEYVGALMGSTSGPGNGNYFPTNGGISNELPKLPEENLVEVTNAIVDGRDVSTTNLELP
ncbi:hypothetical protein EDB80DRAFT_684673 [Ilyonectria destructans]|nr:hypothetical protein EDB80DRAFT_684673 [Ilyonectria destructans]